MTAPPRSGDAEAWFRWRENWSLTRDVGACTARCRRRLLTQRQLASQAGVTRATLVDIEHGRSRPRVGTMRKLAEALGVEVTASAEFKRVIEADDQLSAAA